MTNGSGKKDTHICIHTQIQIHSYVYIEKETCGSFGSTYIKLFLCCNSFQNKKLHGKK